MGGEARGVGCSDMMSIMGVHGLALTGHRLGLKFSSSRSNYFCVTMKRFKILGSEVLHPGTGEIDDLVCSA